MKLPISTLIPWFALALLAGCASTSVTERNPYTGAKLDRPDHIIIHDFSANPADAPAGSAFAGRGVEYASPPTAEQRATVRRLGAAIAQQLASEIRDMGLPATTAAASGRPRMGDLVIRGYFVSVDPGSADQRMLVGFGSGAAELKTAVEGYLVTRQGLRLLGSGQTDAKGDSTPGMLMGVAGLAATGNPIGLILGGASKVSGEQTGSETIDGIAQRTAKDIANVMRAKFQEQGWI